MVNRIEVFDTNVWALIDKIPPETGAERLCILACIEWMRAFLEAEDDYQLAVDMQWKILIEYRNQIRQGGLAEQYLNSLMSQPIKRLKFVSIEYDENGHAILDEDIMDDPSDRKFVAIALSFDDPAPIVNATDTDWEKDRDKLEAAGLTIIQLCPDYIDEKIK